MELNAKNVKEIFMPLFFKEGEEIKNPVLVEGLFMKFGFHPERLEAQRQTVIELLNQLPATFFAEQGGGGSFLRLNERKDGTKWGDQMAAEQLALMALALKLGTYCLPRAKWHTLPEEMPYLVFRTTEKVPPKI